MGEVALTRMMENKVTEKTKLGFVGYGAMASRMAGRLRNAGFGIVATSPHHTTGEVDGTRMLANAMLVAREADVVLICVPADEALLHATEGPDGLLEGARAGQLVIDLSSVSPRASRALAARAARQGIRVVDAPVSGSIHEADAGALVVLAGGAADDIEAARPILQVIGKRIIVAGKSGQGSVMKLAVNAIMGTGLAAIAEAVGYGLAAGLDRDTLFDLLASLAVVSPHHARKLAAAKVLDVSPQFPTRLMLKDMGLVLADAARLGVPMASAAAATQLFALTSRGHADDDYSSAVAVMEDLATSRPVAPPAVL
jgi:3-hydroxyisobutyrate dehydrogenase-like beta-hydroxyacid dehydrogenase